jgi:hypothetical protein
MTKKKRDSPAKPKWVYAYELVPPQPEDRLRPIKTLLQRGRKSGQNGASAWVGSVVVERQVTHILVVCDSPELNCEANRSLEAKLRELKSGYKVTVPMRLSRTDEVDPSP